MLIILAAATVATATPASKADAIADMPNLYRVPAGCENQRYRVVDKYGRPLTERLGELPRVNGAQLLVDRKIDGCRVVTLMGGARPPIADDPNPPPSQYRIQPLRPRSR